MSWPRDDAKLGRVRALMAEQELDALVVRAPDNVLYLTNFWGMKGYDACRLPTRGRPTLICLEPSADDAERMAWTSDVRLFAGYDPNDPRPPTLRALDIARESRRGRVGLELSLGTQATDRMVGEPTTFPKAWFDAWPDALDAAPLLAEARAIKTEQEIERMRLANEIAAAAMEHVQGVLRPGMTCAQAAAEWQGFVHGEGTGWKGQVELALPFSLVWSGPSIKHVHRHHRRPDRRGRTDALRDLGLRGRLLGRPHQEPLPRGAHRALRGPARRARAGLRRRHRVLPAGREPRRARPPGPEGIDAAGYPGQPGHPICHGIGARAHEPPYAHQAGGGEISEGMVLAIEPGIYWEGGGGLRLEDNFLINADGAEKLSPFPDGVVEI